MGLAELLDAPARASTLRVKELLEGPELSKEDRDTFAKAIRDPAVNPTRLETAMAGLGVSCSRTAIVNWRRSNGVAS